MKIPVLVSDRPLLRPFLPADAPEVQRLAGHRAVADTTLHIPYPYEDGTAEAWIVTHQPQAETGVQNVFAITTNDDSRLVGAISLRLDGLFARAELGYWIGNP